MKILFLHISHSPVRHRLAGTKFEGHGSKICDDGWDFFFFHRWTGTSF